MTEILAPAGDEQTAYAGAPSGGRCRISWTTRFSARESAENFCVSALRKLTREAHLLGAKVYVALNTLIREEEVPAFFEAARAAWDGGADAILLQDIFLGRALKEMYPQMVAAPVPRRRGAVTCTGRNSPESAGFRASCSPARRRSRTSPPSPRSLKRKCLCRVRSAPAFSGQCYLSSFCGEQFGQPRSVQTALSHAVHDRPRGV